MARAVIIAGLRTCPTLNMMLLVRLCSTKPCNWFSMIRDLLSGQSRDRVIAVETLRRDAVADFAISELGLDVFRRNRARVGVLARGPERGDERQQRRIPSCLCRLTIVISLVRIVRLLERLIASRHISPRSSWPGKDMEIHTELDDLNVSA